MPATVWFSSASKLVSLVKDGAVLTDWRVKVRVAIRSFENLPVPRRLVMTPCGEVAGFDSENSVPSSVPASHGYRFTTSDGSQSPCASSKDSPKTPVNQSGLGAIIVSRVTRGWSVVSVTVLMVDELVGPILPLPRMTESAFGSAALTSFARVLVPPSSAINSTPALAMPPSLRKVTPAL